MNRAERQSQRIFKKQLIHRCDVFAKKRIRVGSDWQELYVRVETQVSCRMSTNKSSRLQENQVEAMQQFFSPFTLYSLPMQIKSDDRVLLYVKSGDVWEPERFYETKAEPMNPSFLNHHYETACENMTRTYEIKELTLANNIVISYLKELA